VGGGGGGVLSITCEIKHAETSTRRRGQGERRKEVEERKEAQQAQSEVAGNGQPLTHWTNISHFISMTKNTIILDMPGCRFH